MRAFDSILPTTKVKEGALDFKLESQVLGALVRLPINTFQWIEFIQIFRWTGSTTTTEIIVLSLKYERSEGEKMKKLTNCLFCFSNAIGITTRPTTFSYHRVCLEIVDLKKLATAYNKQYNVLYSLSLL